MARNQLPPQIRKIVISDRKTKGQATRYEVTVDAGYQSKRVVDTDGTVRIVAKRIQSRKRYLSEKEARAALAEIVNKVGQGTYVHPSALTVARACQEWLDSKLSLKPSSLESHRKTLAPVSSVLGTVAVQKLTKRDLEDLVRMLRAGGLPLDGNRVRKPWSARTVNYMLGLVTSVLRDQLKQGNLVRNVGELVDRLPSESPETKTLTRVEVKRLLAFAETDRLAPAWHLALCGLRRGEISGLRWSDVDLNKNTMTIANNRIVVGRKIIEGKPKSRKSNRKLPLPEGLGTVLRRAKTLQAAEKLAMGVHYVDSAFVIRDKDGLPFHPNLLTFRWGKLVLAAGVTPVRLHDARHTCATLMHMQGVPIAVIAQWLGHASAAFTMSVYAHSQTDALESAARSFR